LLSSSDPELERLFGARPRGWRRIESAGYGRVSAHWHVELEDGRSVFVKEALSDEAADWLRAERLVYEHVEGPFMPAYFGTYDRDGAVLLAIEDLGSAEWPPPWTPERIDSVLTSLAAVRKTTPPEGLPRLEELRDAVVGWPSVRDDPEPLLATGVCSRAWLERALPELLRAGEDVELGGGELLHLDVRSDNLCFKGPAALLVDWNLACVGDGRFDVAFWLPSLRLEGGPQPCEVLRDAGALAAAVAGFFAARAGLPIPSGAPTVREFQRRQLQVALPWAAQELGLSPPDEREHARP
jgi:hypothetical protein